MSLFSKKKEEKQMPACGCACNGMNTANEADLPESDTCCAAKKDGACRVKVLGSGCKNCRALLENTKKAIADNGFEAEVEYVTDLQRITEYGVMSMPALIIDEKVASMGRVCRPDEIADMLKKFGC